MRNQTAAKLDPLQVEVDALKCLQAETAAEVDALLPATLPPSRGFDGTGDRAFIRLHPISAGQEGEL